eukprot:gene4551-14730_t
MEGEGLATTQAAAQLATQGAVEEEQQDDVVDFIEIERLIEQGIAAGDLKKAKDAGFHTCMSIVMATKKVLCNVKGLSEAKVDKMVEAATRLSPDIGWHSGTAELQSLPSAMGGGEGKVAYIDAEGAFRPEHIMKIAERFGLNPGAVLDNEPFKMLIMDGIMSLLKVDFCGRGELSERQQKLGKMLSMLRKLSEEFNVAVVVTNQVISDPGGGAMFVSDPKKAIGGHVLAHACTSRILVRKGKGEQRVMKLIKCPSQPESESSFQITDAGIAEYKD